MATETAIIAGQTWTIDRTFRHLILLTNERGTVRSARSHGRGTMFDLKGRDYQYRGSVVRINVTDTTIEQID